MTKTRKWIRFYTRQILRNYPRITLISLITLTFFLYPHSRPQVETPSPPVSKFIFPSPTPDPSPKSQNLPLPAVSARHFLILDRDTKQIMYQQLADDPVPPASTTKIMTALVALDTFPLNQQITVDKSYSDGQVIGFQPGEILTVEQLLYALLVQSGNDAAEILAENFPGGHPAFISAMNAKASDLHLSHTAYTNPTGLDEAGHYSSAVDLARLADVAMDNPEFARIVGTENAVLPGNHVLTNLNQLLGKVPGVLGIKTGFTDNAGQALVTLVNRGHPIIIVILKSTDRFTDTRKLIDWSYQNFTFTEY
ncbi:D-alanyl-D-alanine carboxypeptidase [Candidatus Amesbacteria bacterium]|nr:D-alanyl-D-alanine carboxypeptidase [Candidatus Amesbacteria bacterium]MBI2587291.1 D-alanyl-D-alanine carboxypeptidase [Candidatus Amesbacteria bacterium]